MKEITLLDIAYTVGMLFVVFYGSIVLTKFLSKNDEENDSEESPEK
ncbi:MAG: hypothetical protein IE918_01590 [Campylobacterales bacterium]|nr:hypothetical protein [Campylobacterales bacterium]